MTLSQGHALAHYTILGPLGAGAMGEVYRAKDSKLGREVAIKVLPEHFADDEERLRRFEREAKTLASLNHPNVAQIFGVDQVGDTCFLVLELVPGESLDERLKRGPLPIDDALDVCKQIAEGLEAAHEAGVIHRDLKPANVRITPEGKVKVLDFGLAKPANEMHQGSSTDSVLSTEAGRLLGTPTYMAPEQARGKSIDRRVDVWAFGCVLYECLTGKRAFVGETMTDVLGAVLHTEPDLARLPANTPARVRELLVDCLAKDPRVRARDIGEIRRQLERVRAEPKGIEPKKSKSVSIAVIAAAVASSLVGAFAARALLATAHPKAQASPTRFTVTIPEVVHEASDRVRGVALRADGRLLAISVHAKGSGIYIRELSALEAKLLPGTDGARDLSFSPDGRWLAYYDDDRAALRRVALEGGSPQTIALMRDAGGISWGAGDRIATAPEWGGGLVAIDVSSGAQESLTQPDTKAGERGHLEPCYLPGSHALLYETWKAEEWDRAEIGVLDLTSGKRHVVQFGGISPQYLPLDAHSGAMLYVRSGSLWGRRFDLAALDCRGEEVLLLDGIHSILADGTARYSISASGTLAYQPRLEVENQAQVVWVDREGKIEPAVVEKGHHDSISLSADGTRLLFASGTAVFHLYWIDMRLPFEERRSQQLTFGDDTFDCILAPDGARVAYSSNRGGTYNLYVQDFAQGAPPLKLFDGNAKPRSWSPDGKWIAFVASTPGKSEAPDVWIVPADGSAAARPFLHTPADEHEPQFSPDGKWLAFTSNESGIEQIWVTPFPAGDRRLQVSHDGGWTPRWSRDGSELLFRSDGEYFSVNVVHEPAFSFSAPRRLFSGAFDENSTSVGLFQAPDGRFLMNQPIMPKDSELRVVVVENFVEDVKAKLGQAVER